MAEIVIKLVNGELAGKTFQGITKEVRAAKLELDKAVTGTQEWVDATMRLQKAKDVQEAYSKQLKSTAAASDMLKAAWNKLPGAQFFNSIGDSLGMMKSGVGGLVSQFGVLKVAIAATGIGLIILAVMALIGAFSKFTPIVDKVEQVLSGISAVISELWQRIQQFGVGLFKILTGAPGGVDQLAGSFDGLGDSIMNAYDAGVQLKKLQQDLEDAARGLEVANARAERQVEKLIIMAKNKSRSDREQIDLLLEARKIADENHKKNDQQKQSEFDTLIKEAQTKSSLSKEEIIQLMEGTLAQEIEFEKRGTIEDELLDKIRDAMIERINAEGATNKLLEKIQNAEDARQEKRLADQEKARKKALDAELKALKEEQDAKDNIRKLEGEKRVAQLDDEKAKEIEKLNIDTEEKIIALQGSEAQILEQTKLLREIQAAELDAIDKKWADKKAADDKKAKEHQIAEDKKQADEQKQIAADKAKFEQDIEQMKREMVGETVSFAVDMLASQAKSEKEAKRIRKAGALVDIGINLQKELSANSAVAATMYPPANLIYLGTANARSLIRAAIGAGRVLAFGKGGIPDGVLRGPSHEQGGIPLIAEGREIILAKGVFDNPKLRAMASEINVAGGGRSFATGGPVDPFQNRVSIPSNSSTSKSQNTIDTANQMMAEFKAFRQEISGWQRNIKVINVVTETDEGIKTVNAIRDEADV